MRLGMQKKPRRIGGAGGGNGGAEIQWQQLTFFFCRHDHNSDLTNWLHQLRRAKEKPLSEPGGSEGDGRGGISPNVQRTSW